MNHRRDRPALGAYALGALPPDEERAVEHHVATCDDCFIQLIDFLRLRNWLSQVPPEAFLNGPPDDDQRQS
jgi:anti-sigma factor RsiW